jgi:hypothetical protein
MAIFDNFHVAFSIHDGEKRRPLPEYEDTTTAAEDSKGDSKQMMIIINRYLEAEENTYYTIHFEVGPGLTFKHDEYIVARIFLDGEKVSSPVMHVADYLKTQHWSTWRAGSNQGSARQWMLRRFEFAGLPTSK